MGKTIYKYGLGMAQEEIEMPVGSTILHIGTQHGKICMWVEVNPENPIVKRTIEIYGTGDLIRQDMGISKKYLGTVKLNDETLILHVYESI